MLLNQPRALDAMRRCGLDALVATSPVNVTYFSDYYCWLDPLTKNYMMNPGSNAELALRCYAVLPAEGASAVVIPSAFAVNAADSWVADLYSYGNFKLDGVTPAASFPEHFQRILASQSERNTAKPEDALISLLRARGLSEAKIGIEKEGLTPSAWEAIVNALPRAEFKDCTNLLRLVRMLKSAEEVKRLTRAAEIGDTAALESLSMAKPGCRMGDLIQHFRVRVAELGAAFDHFAFGIHGLGIAMEPDYVLDAEDVMYTDYGCVSGYYYSDSGATLAVSEPPKEMAHRYAALDSCIEAGAAALQPGTKSSAVQKIMAEVLESSGITSSFPHGLGLGLEVRDYPILVPNNGLRIQDDCIDEASDLLIELGAFLNLEASVFMPGLGSLQIEKSYVIDEIGSHQVGLQKGQPIIPQS